MAYLMCLIFGYFVPIIFHGTPLWVQLLFLTSGALVFFLVTQVVQYNLPDGLLCYVLIFQSCKG